MKKMMTMVGVFAALLSSAQTDSTEHKPDTIKVGNFIIIKKDKKIKKVIEPNIQPIKTKPNIVFY
jgi:hypothetical protein